MTYSTNVIWSDEDEEFVATSPEFPGASGFGSTWQEATGDLLNAIEGILESMGDRGKPAPEPRKLEDFSGRTGAIAAEHTEKS